MVSTKPQRLLGRHLRLNRLLRGIDGSVLSGVQTEAMSGWWLTYPSEK
jgi:hypothetical protein